jgi:hypothetical protein
MAGMGLGCRMGSEGLSVDQLRDYLRELTPQARTMLVAELERAKLRGDAVPGADLILQELRAARAPGERPPPRIGNPQRLFFQPLQPFLMDGQADRRQRGRIARASLDPIWQWLARDLVPVETKAYADHLSRHLLAGEAQQADQLAKAFQDRVVQRIQETIGAASHDDKALRRLAAQVGVPHAIEELREIVSVLKVRDAIAVIASRLPVQIKNLADETLDSVKALLDSPVARHRDVFAYGVLLVWSRLTSPWQLIRLATRAAVSDAADRIAETPFSVAVTIVIDDVEEMVSRLRAHLKSRDAAAVATLLKDIHDGVRALRTELDLSVDSPWARQLARIRGDVSELLKAAVETAPGRVRRLLGQRTQRDIAAGSALDSIEVGDTEAMIELVSVCRNYANELAINEVTLRVYSELQSHLDTAMNPLLDSLRHAGDVDRAFRQSQVDAAVRFAAKIFGPSYASLFAKAAEVAAQGERKIAKA